MKWHSARRILGDFRRHPWLHLVTIATIALASFVLGLFLISYRNFEIVSQKTSPKVMGTVYLKDGLSPVDIENLRERILALSWVKQVIFKDRGSVVSELQVFLGDANSEQLTGGEIFPDILEVHLQLDAPAEDIRNLNATISGFAGVSEVDFSENWLAQYRRVRDFLRFLGIALIALVVVGCGFIIANFMGMRHQSRRHEFEVVRLMGASHRFLFSPFLTEGIVEGILGSGLALLGLFVSKWFITSVLAVQWGRVLGLESWVYLSPLQTLGLVSVGIFMAFLGSLTVFLRFRETQ